MNECCCVACLKMLPPDDNPIPHHRRRMVVCSICGNKRCPHAQDHRYACTGSNETNQTPTPMSSEVKRYDLACDYSGGSMKPHESGDYVEWDDYAAAIAERDAAQRESFDLRVEHANHFADVRRIEEWLETTKPANTAFTEGAERTIAYHLEHVRQQRDAARAEVERLMKLLAAYDTSDVNLATVMDQLRTKLAEAVSLLRRWETDRQWPHDRILKLLRDHEAFLATIDAEAKGEQ